MSRISIEYKLCIDVIQIDNGDVYHLSPHIPQLFSE